MKALIQLLGLVGLVMGLLWVGQGLGVVRWPASSSMIANREWVVNGAFLALVGMSLVWLAGRLR